MKYTVLVGRICYSLIFILASFGHFTSHSIQYAAQSGVPFASLLVPLSGLMCLIGGISILLGYKAKIGAWLIVVFLLIVSIMMHAFWSIQDPLAASLERIMFLKNLSMLGGALLITYFGSGPLSWKE